MDPLSITTGVVTLVETGTRLSKTLYDLYTSYRAAEPTLQDLASEVDLITSLFDSLNTTLSRKPQTYSKDFQQSTRNLIAKCHTIFEEIEAMIPARNESGDVKRREKLMWAAFTKDKVEKKKEELRRVAHMFLFVETVNRCVERPGRQSISPSANGLQDSNFGGVLSQVPAQLNGDTADGSGAAMFEATLTLKPAVAPESRMTHPMTYSAERTRESRRDGFTRLQNMRMSPFFDKNLLGEQEKEPQAVEINPRSARNSSYVDAVPYNDVHAIDLGSFEDHSSPHEPSPPENKDAKEPMNREEAAKDVSELLCRWSKSDPQSSTRFSSDSAESLGIYSISRDTGYASGSYGVLEKPLSPSPHPNDEPRVTEPQIFGVDQPQIIEPQEAEAERPPPPSRQSARPKSAREESRPHRSYAHFCDGCGQGIEGVRHRCTECDFNYCGLCYMYPPMRHAHPLSQFDQIR